MKYCQKALEIAPTEHFILDSMGYALAGKGKHQEAIDYYHKAISVYPKDPEQMMHLADSYKALGENTQAIEYYKKALDLKPRPELKKKVETSLNFLENK